MGTSQNQFDYSTPLARARLLANLKRHADQFTQEEQELYDAFRDALIRVARGENVTDKLSTYSTAFARFLDTDGLSIPHAPAVAAEPREITAPQSVSDVPLSAPSDRISLAQTEPTVTTATPGVQTSFARVRRGPDIAVSPHSASSSTVAGAPVQPEPVLPQSPLVAPTPREEVVQEENRAEAHEVLPVSPEPLAQLHDLPSESAESIVEQGEKVVDAPIAEQQSPEPASLQTPASAVEAVSSLPENREDLREEIEKINDALNEFAHGTAFKWLSDEKTGYRAYLNELLELRGIFSGPVSAAPETTVLRERVGNLRTLADAVRRNTGNAHPTPMAESEVVEHVAPASEEKNDAPTPPVDTDAVTASVAQEGTRDVRVTISPAHGPLIMDEVMEETKEESVSVPETSLSESPESVPPMPVEMIAESPTEMASDVGDSSAPLLAEDEPESALMDKVPVPESPLLDPLNTRPIDAGLNDLLTRWLGSTGFFGFGDSGVKHPDWLLMKDAFVDDVLHGDGVVPPGLRPELFENLGQNIRAWRDAYGLSPEDGERVEHYIRRVVVASMPPSA